MTIDGERFTYISFTYVTQAYWMVSFAFLGDILSENEGRAPEYEKTVKIEKRERT